MSAIHFDNPAASFYDMFADSSSLQAIMKMRARDNQSEIIYLGSHGNENNIGPNAANAVSRAKFRNIIRDENSAGNIKGLYLGTCLTGNEATARFLLLGADTKLEWLAGYKKSVEWVDGSAIDMIFFGKLAQEYLRNAKRRKGKRSARRMAHDAATALLRIVPGAHSAYGFNMFFCDNGKLTSMFGA